MPNDPFSPTVSEAAKVLNARNDLIREQWTGVMEARLVREELIKCRRVEGVNSYVKCKHLADLYIDLLRTSGVTGYRKVNLDSK